jgi:two-component system, OmpR family, sensor kinase
MSVPGGIRAKLMLALLVIVGGALAGVYLMVVPSLERQLVDAKLDQLGHNADQTAAGLVSSDLTGDPEAIARGLGAAFGARVILYRVYGPPTSLGIAVDSAGGAPGAMARDPIALAAVEKGRARGRVMRDGGEYGEVATQLFTGEVLLLSGSLSDQLNAVALVKRRLLLASALAILVALGLGAVAAGMHARRIRRIERAALRIAEGSFDEPLVDRGDDELAELAASFERMREQLRQLDNARKEFVANASHELRTPLFSLAGFLELLADEELDEETRTGFLTTTREQVERLTRLAANLLDLSRIDVGRLHVEREEVDLSEIATTLVEELRPIGELTGHAVSAEVHGAVWALADEERVFQVARALAGNALVHTPSGSQVVIGASETPDGVALTVSDDGLGISPEHLERVFDRFYRADGTHASGSGLGLAIARELALRMDGRIALESQPGLTRFTVSLPPAELPA